jgi:glycosyltransferase involved in cell wall biosynthesis
LNVLLLINAFEIGGAEQDVLRLARGLVRRGHRVVVGSGGGELIPEARSVGAIVEPLAAPGAQNLWLGGFAAIVRMCRRHDVDVVNAHSLRTITQAGLLSRAHLIRSPVVGTIHNVTNRANDPVARRLLRWMPHALTFVSSYERERLTGGSGGCLGRVVYTGLELPGAEPEPAVDLTERHRIPRDVRVLGFVGRLSPEKALGDVVEAMAQLPTDVFLCVVGDGPERACLERQVRNQGLADRIVFAGGRRDVGGYLRSFDLLVLPSRREALPVVVREAMALGTPVVAADVGGVREAVRSGETGILYPSGDLPALTQAIRELLEDAERRRQMAEAGRRVVAERFSLDRWLDEMEGLFGEVVRIGSTTGTSRSG